MTEVKHTPGPWEYEEFHFGTGGYCIGPQEGDAFVIGVKEADARLIAAAPELLAEHKANLDLIAPFEDWQLATLPAWARTALELVKRNSSEVVAKAEASK